MKKSSQWPERNSNPELCMWDCESDVLSTRPRCLLRFAKGLSLPALHPIARSEKKKKLFILFYLFYRQNIPRVRRLQAHIFGLVRQIHQASPIYSYQLPHLQSRYMKIAPNSS